ncbi:MAG: Unknown protein [uncultured Aureispira sp.]|uniref:Uncharacterized protein n=1 Tax=uncultured Aureispira sp. TaxID=1331704 RepID=A0A6S6SUJ5_9BACT|nr:MAG: Unknown protein [uncultured Aureispira sp.]
MCTLSQGFKLCSCDGDKLATTEIGWILKRRDQHKKISAIKGKPFVYQMNTSEKQLKAETVQALNQRNCFDFDYQPKEDDFLQIKTGENNLWLAFRYQKGLWKADSSTKFSSWRQQLEMQEEGFVRN